MSSCGSWRSEKPCSPRSENPVSGRTQSPSECSHTPAKSHLTCRQIFLTVSQFDPPRVKPLLWFRRKSTMFSCAQNIMVTVDYWSLGTLWLRECCSSLGLFSKKRQVHQHMPPDDSLPKCRYRTCYECCKAMAGICIPHVEVTDKASKLNRVGCSGVTLL